MTDVFVALGDGTRRSLLDRLRREGALSVSELSAPLPISRQAVTKHLDVLEDAGLVRRSVEGRRRLHSLRPQGLGVVADWLEPYERAWDERLERLQRHLGSPGETDSAESRTGGET